MSDDYRDSREEEYWAQKYAEDDSYRGGRGGKDATLRKVWDLFWTIIGLLTIAKGKSPVFGMLIMLWASIYGKMIF